MLSETSLWPVAEGPASLFTSILFANDREGLRVGCELTARIGTPELHTLQSLAYAMIVK